MSVDFKETAEGWKLLQVLLHSSWGSRKELSTSQVGSMPFAILQLLKNDLVVITNPEVTGLKSLGGSMVDSVFYPSQINQISTRISSKCLLTVALQTYGRQTLTKRGPIKFFLKEIPNTLKGCYWCDGMSNQKLYHLLPPKRISTKGNRKDWGGVQVNLRI